MKHFMALLDDWEFTLRQNMFKMAMKSNSKVAMLPPFDVNPLSHLWRTMNASYLLTLSIVEYVKLVEIAVVDVLGSIDDERCLFSLSFLKNKLRNTLDKQLPLVVGMYL